MSLEYSAAFGNLRDFDFFHQLGAAVEKGHCRFVSDGWMVLYEERSNARVGLLGGLVGDAIVIALADLMGRGGRWQGGEHPKSALAYARDGQELDLILPKVCKIPNFRNDRGEKWERPNCLHTVRSVFLQSATRNRTLAGIHRAIFFEQLAEINRRSG